MNTITKLDFDNVKEIINENKGEKYYLMWVTFAVGMCSIGIERTVSRLLTPYFGSSMYVWTSLSAAIMLCMCIGYYLGGYFSDKYESKNLMSLIILGIGIYFSIIPFVFSFLADPLLFFATIHPVKLFVISFITGLLLLGTPYILMGAVIPYTIKMLTNRISSSGRNIGTIAALSTIGSIVGMFISVFAAIPFWGTKKTILYFGLFLLVTGTIGFVKNLKNVSK